MESSADTSASTEEAPKKSPYDDLSRDDLIKKCKGLLGIAQKAKQSKQELQSEVDTYRERLEQSVRERDADRDSLRTLQELVDSLTEQKLSYITELDAAGGRSVALSAKYEEALREVVRLSDECAAHEARHAEVAARSAELDCEVVSLRRQHKRLQDENEELISQLSEQEARAAEFNSLGLQQQEQLRRLEETVGGGTIENIEEYKNKIEQLNEQIASLENNIKIQNEKLTEKDQAATTLQEKLSEEARKYEIEKEKTERASSRLKIYRDKIVKCSACITQLKNSKFILLKTVKDYSESIPKWQDDMIKISKMLNNQFAEILSENKSLNQKLSDYEGSLTVAKNNIGDLEKENQILISKNNELESMIKSLQSKNTENDSETSEILSLQIKSLESEKLTLVKEKQAARDSLVDLEAQNKMFATDVKNLKSNIDILESRVNYLECENKTLKEQLKQKDTDQCKILKEEHKLLQEQFDALKVENANLEDLNNLLKEEVDTLKSSLEQPNDDGENLSDLNVSLQTDIMKLETKLGAYKQENASLLIEVKESRTKIKELSASNTELEDIKAKMLGYKTENSELLNEMKEINQVLKERGESISKQQKAIAEMERLIETLEKDREALSESKGNLEHRVKGLEEEIENLNAKTSNESEEAGKVRAEYAEAKQLLEEKETFITSLKEEIERLRQQHLAGNMDQPNEDMSTSTISRAEDHSRMKELDDTFEDKYTKLRIFALKLKKRVNEMTVQLENAEADKSKLEKLLNEKTLTKVEEKPAEHMDLKVGFDQVDYEVVNTEKRGEDTMNESILRQQVELLKKDLEAARNSDSETDKLKSEIARLAAELSAESERHRATQESLEKARRDVKKKSVLSLEMEDYERSMRDLTTKMEDNKKKMVQMESTIDTQQGTINSLKTQIKLLEDQVKTEENQNRLTKEELHEAIERLKERDTLVQAKNEIISKLERDIERSKGAYEDLNVEMTSLLGDKEQVILGLGQDKLDLTNRLKRVEVRCSEMEDSHRITNIELEDLKTEFASYKVRAQAVLRQSHTVDPGQEERLKEEMAALRAQHDSLAAQLQAANAAAEEARGACAAERRRSAEAGGEAERARQRTARLHADLQRLAQQLDAERAQAKLQTATLTQCYKSQLAELEARLERETAALRREAEAARAVAAAGEGRRDFPAAAPRDDSDGELDVNVAMLTREEGEGSEAAPSPTLAKAGSGSGARRSPVPLDRLLEEGVPDEETEAPALGLTAEQELAEAKRKLHAQIKRVEHVTLLLAESERECARLSQLGDLLKAEVRRARGTQHAHNTQYMKNVTLKFLTLGAGDERARLVPVLQKLLTLSNEEAHTLTAVAKGQDPNAKGGWGSYLPWSGGK